MRIFKLIFSVSSLFIATGCHALEQNSNMESIPSKDVILLQAESFSASSNGLSEKSEQVLLEKDEWLSYEISVPAAGRYKVEVNALSEENGNIWIEDYIDNTDGRTYNITGAIQLKKDPSEESSYPYVDGSPLNAGIHKIKVHASKGSAQIDWIKFSLIQKDVKTKKVFEQTMDGNEWELVWSDEFNGSGLPDSNKWSYNIGNWGWGNNEPQYFTSNRTENARQENGNLIIEARKNDMGKEWTSARLTTHGKEAFLYGKIEFRAKVPVKRGTWAAGWLLGDEYVDELSWPYCGEIDVLECVGFEIDDETGKGLNHCTCHTRSYYFKQGNQIGATIEVENMNSEYHVYAIEWYPDVIYGLIDGERYYTYDKNKDELEWPFFKAQNIILNLTIGGGWGGAKGVDENFSSEKYIIDYVRVYQLK
jgi:beta-glucanase (GH16 family)